VTTPAQPNPGALALPEGLTEGDMIDLIDGRLAPEREAFVLMAIKAEPRLAVLVRRLREDAAAVAGLDGGIEVPADLADRVEAQLHAEALASLAAQEADAPLEPAVTSVVTVSSSDDGSPWRLVLESAWTRRLATAASIAIVAGAGLLAYHQFAPAPPPGPGPIGPIAVTPAAPGPGEPGPGLEAGPEVAVATAPDASSIGQPPPLIADPPAVAATISPERALELARQGRLAISVRLPHAEAGALKRIEALARAAGREGGWREVGLDRVPVAYASLLTPTMTVPSLSGPARPPILVAGEERGVRSGVDARVDLSFQRRAVVRAIWSVDVSPRAAAIAGLLDALSPGRPDGAVLVERDAPMLPPPALTPEDVLWWHNPPSTWGTKVSIPVVVEDLE
jgi:hypothetical protein